MDRRKFFQTSCGAAAGALLPTLPLDGLDAAKGLNGSRVPNEGPEATLYVATDGHDNNPGTKKRPLATLDRARMAVRELKARTKAPISVWVRGGTYYSYMPMVFDPADSGREDQPITYAAHPGELVTLSGGTKLDCRWESYRDGIMKCALPEIKRSNLTFTQLFVDGKRQIRARYPNYDAKNPLPGGAGYINMAKPDPDWPATEFHYDPDTFTKKQWARPEEAIVHTFPETFIGNLQWQVRNIDWDQHIVKLGRGGFQINDLIFGKICTGIGSKSRFFVENVFEELDSPSEWYFDKDQGTLYYMPADGVDLRHALVEAPILEQLIEFRGSQTDPVKHIRLSGFRIAHTASTFLGLYEAPSGGDWTIHRGGAVFVEGAEDCRVEKCYFDAVGGNGVFINNYARRIRVSGNKFTETGDSPICLVGSENVSIGSNEAFSSENTISNNLIHDCGVFGKQIAGVFVSIGQKATISHNLIYRMPRAGICINDGNWGGHVVEFNRIYDTVRETSDHGSFNSWDRGRYWCLAQSHGDASHEAKSKYLQTDVRADTRYTNIIRNNYFREHHEWSADLDDGSSNYHIYNNVSVGVSIKLREGDYRVVENNIIYHPKNQPGFQIPYEDNNDVFVRNIIVTTAKPPEGTDLAKIRPGVGSEPGDIYAHIWPPLQGRMAKEVDYNLFFSDVGQFYASIIPRQQDWNLGSARKRLTLEEWRALGYDEHSAFADPLFVDAEREDFRLRPESPALKLGFKNFEVSSSGLQADFPQEWLVESEKEEIAKGRGKPSK